MKVLLVEDSLVLSNLISESLKENGFKCVTRTSSLGALEFLESHKTDVLITNLHLPHISGEELSQIVKEKFRIPTILTSKDYAISDSKNFDGFILKPFEVEELIEMIELVARKNQSLRPQDMR